MPDGILHNNIECNIQPIATQHNDIPKNDNKNKTLSIMTPSKMTFSIITLRTTKNITLSIATFNIMIFSKMTQNKRKMQHPV